MLRVLVVDDSSTCRQILVEILDRDPEVQVVGQATNGQEAIELAKKLRPDLITMDINMPRMDGFEVTREIMIDVPTPTVIVSASTAVHEVETGMQALQAGALTLMLKPPGAESPQFEKSAAELVDTVKTMADVKVVRRTRRTAQPKLLSAEPLESKEPAVRLCAIATSTGGPPALSKVLAPLQEDFPVPILVVQHIARGFTEGLAAWLDSAVPMRVKVAEAGELLIDGTVYVAPEDRHLGVTRRGTVTLSSSPPIGGFRPSANYLFESVANSYTTDVVAIIMTGMGHDGVEGLRRVRDAGGRIIAQDRASCVVFGMPGAAVEAGLVNDLVTLESIPQELLRVVGTPAKRT